MELLVLGLVATVGFASYVLWSKAKKTEQEGPGLLEAPERTLFTLQPGDIVQHLGTDWLVEGVLALSEDGSGSRLYKLVDGLSARYLYAPSGGGDPLLLDARPLPVEGTPESLVVDGRTFVLTSRLSAAVQRGGAGFERHAGERVATAEYTSGAGRVMLFNWTDRIDSFVGERIGAGMLELLPGK